MIDGHLQMAGKGGYLIHRFVHKVKGEGISGMDK